MIFPNFEFNVQISCPNSWLLSKFFFWLSLVACVFHFARKREVAGLRFALAVSGISLAAGIVLQSLGLWSFGIIHRSSFIII